ncbi:MAG: sulfur carrier protein ThiS [Muribaculaceae bacterium]|nr:sulfur carrier protein ThiS [Muribaculaceae bacterium]
MVVEINNHAVEVANGCDSLLQLLEQEGFSGQGKAVAVNNRVVKRSDWATTPLTDGMKITVISAVCGG